MKEVSLHLEWMRSYYGQPMHAYLDNANMQGEACLQVCDLRKWQGATLRGSGKEAFLLLSLLLQLTRPERAVLPSNL